MALTGPHDGRGGPAEDDGRQRRWRVEPFFVDPGQGLARRIMMIAPESSAAMLK